MAERLLILGAGVMQWPAIRIARAMGLETVVVDADPNAPCVPMADRFERIDLKDKEGIAGLGRGLLASGPLGIMTAGTDFSAAVAWAAEKLDLPGIPYETALNASDKERMRRCFKAAGLPSPEFLVLTEPPGPELSLPFAYPVVVKPVDNMGGRGCRRVDTIRELIGAAGDAFKFSASGRVIVEEFMDGGEFSADAIVYRGNITICGFADRHIRFPPFFVEMGHTMPSDLDRETAGALLEIFTAGIRALGITNGAAKGDLKLSSRGPMIGEIAARLSGGYMSGWTYPYSSGVEATRGAILVAMGKAPGGLEPKRKWTSAERAVLSIPGKIRAIYGAKEARAVTHIRDIFFRVEPGAQVGFPENNVSKCGNVISAAELRADAVGAAEKAARLILIRLEVPNMETEDFLMELSNLASADKFPPDAFTLPETPRTLLAMLPEPEYTIYPGRESLISIYPFQELTESELLDYAGRTVKDCLEAVRTITGLPLPLAEGGKDVPGIILGRMFWNAMIRGGCQGAAYVVDRLVLRLQGGREAKK
ncbi:MAG: ATP-grasp domain-containing protein [Spirochaetaceae bacterium]|jgi:biotin carboxylase|nr:ATP-grasp domain-containing protein [Spirochaetaceae bacterium]